MATKTNKNQTIIYSEPKGYFSKEMEDILNQGEKKDKEDKKKSDKKKSKK